jgi:hypothetical protein
MIRFKAVSSCCWKQAAGNSVIANEPSFGRLLPSTSASVGHICNGETSIVSCSSNPKQIVVSVLQSVLAVRVCDGQLLPPGIAGSTATFVYAD